MLMWDGPGPCMKCNSHNLSHNSAGEEYCVACGVVQYVYMREQMIGNLLKYGFKEVEVFEPPTFFQKILKSKTKQLESYYKYGSIIAEHIKEQSNMTLILGSKKINLHYYGKFDYVKGQLDKIINDKTTQRRLKLEKLKNECNNN